MCTSQARTEVMEPIAQLSRVCLQLLLYSFASAVLIFTVSFIYFFIFLRLSLHYFSFTLIHVLTVICCQSCVYSARRDKPGREYVCLKLPGWRSKQRLPFNFCKTVRSKKMQKKRLRWRGLGWEEGAKTEKEEICAAKLNSSSYLPHSVPPAKWSLAPVLLFANSFLLLLQRSAFWEMTNFVDFGILKVRACVSPSWFDSCRQAD